jgi:hypothetical protein
MFSFLHQTGKQPTGRPSHDFSTDLCVNALLGRYRFFLRCTNHFQVKQRLFRFGFIDETDGQSGMNHDIVAWLRFRNTGQLAFSLYATKFNQPTSKHGISIQPLQQFSWHSKAHRLLRCCMSHAKKEEQDTLFCQCSVSVLSVWFDTNVQSVQGIPELLFNGVTDHAGLVPPITGVALRPCSPTVVGHCSVLGL